MTHVALTHGHDDHLGDAGEICAKTGATLFAVFELAQHIASLGAKQIEYMNTGGTVKAADFALTFVDALHSSSSGGIYLGNPCGIVIRTDKDGALYHMGDTEIFPGMALINELHRPDIGIVPIGDRFTMGARSAALACRKFFSFRAVLPCHYGTFPGMLDPDAGAFLAEMKGANVVVPKVGESVEV